MPVGATRSKPSSVKSRGTRGPRDCPSASPVERKRPGAISTRGSKKPLLQLVKSEGSLARLLALLTIELFRCASCSRDLVVSDGFDFDLDAAELAHLVLRNRTDVIAGLLLWVGHHAAPMKQGAANVPHQIGDRSRTQQASRAVTAARGCHKPPGLFAPASGASGARFSTSFALTSEIEEHRTLGARSQWRGDDCEGRVQSLGCHVFKTRRNLQP